MKSNIRFRPLQRTVVSIKVFGIVTNRDVNGNDLINWLHERCGESEEVHRAMKDDFAGGKLPQWWIWSERGLVVDHAFGAQS